MRSVKVDGDFATVGAREDIDGAYPEVVFCPDRRAESLVEIRMEPRTARALARKLNRWAKLVSS